MNEMDKTQTEVTSNTDRHSLLSGPTKTTVDLLETWPPYQLMKEGAVSIQEMTGIRDPSATWMRNPDELANAIYHEMFDEVGVKPHIISFIQAVVRHSPLRGEPRSLAVGACQYASIMLFGRLAMQ